MQMVTSLQFLKVTYCFNLYNFNYLTYSSIQYTKTCTGVWHLFEYLWNLLDSFPPEIWRIVTVLCTIDQKKKENSLYKS